jgi:hypothetical protein
MTVCVIESFLKGGEPLVSIYIYIGEGESQGIHLIPRAGLDPVDDMTSYGSG